MKLTRTYLKRLIKETMGDATQDTSGVDLKSSAAARSVIDAIERNKTIQMRMDVLKKKPQPEKDAFVAYFAKLLGVDLTGGVSVQRVKTAQQQSAKRASENEV
jgi:hypothetical protein